MKLQLRFGLIGSVESIKFLIGILGPDDKATKMATRGKEENVQAVNIKDVNAGKVAEGSEKGTLLLVDDQRSFSLDVSPVSGFSFSCSDFLGVLHFLDISISFQSLEEFDSLAGLIKGSDGVSANNKGDFRDLLDSVATG